MKSEKVIELAIGMVGMRQRASFEIEGFNKLGLVGGPLGCRMRPSSGALWAFRCREGQQCSEDHGHSCHKAKHFDGLPENG